MAKLEKRGTCLKFAPKTQAELVAHWRNIAETLQRNSGRSMLAMCYENRARELEQALAAEAQVLSVILDELVSLDDMHCDERGPYYVMTAEERITWARLPEAHRDAIDHRVGKKNWRGFAAEVDELEAVLAAEALKEEE